MRMVPGTCMRGLHASALLMVPRAWGLCALCFEAQKFMCSVCIHSHEYFCRSRMRGWLACVHSCGAVGKNGKDLETMLKKEAWKPTKLTRYNPQVQVFDTGCPDSSVLLVFIVFEISEKCATKKRSL